MVNPIYFTDGAKQVEYNINLYSHHNSHAIFNLSNKPNYSITGIEIFYVNKIQKEMATISATLINKYKCKHQQFFSKN